jgi:hypothetical protein
VTETRLCGGQSGFALRPCPLQGVKGDPGRRYAAPPESIYMTLFWSRFNFKVD